MTTVHVQLTYLLPLVHSTEMQYPELPVVAFLAAFLVLVPLPLHWRARNIATLALIFWLFITDVIYGVNAIVWAGNVDDPIPIFRTVGR